MLSAASPTAAHLLTKVDALGLALQGLIGVVAALVVAVIVHVVVRRFARRSVIMDGLSRRGRVPFRLFLLVIVLQQLALRSTGTNGWLVVVRDVLALALIATIAWLVVVALLVVEDVILATYRVDVADNLHARRVRTQVTIVRRVLVGAVVVLAVGAMLLTFQGARQVGAGIFASAGLLSVVAGLAAQTSLANVFAGLQLAFTDALRVDDVVVVQQEWGRIEELTLTYVVVHIWDDRRLVLPSTYFTSTPFENWTRRDAALLGVVLLEVDWSTDFDAMRAELHRVIETDELWDGRVVVLQVTDAVGSYVQVRILVSAQDGPTVFDLRCHVREAMVRWLVASDPDGLPRLRVTSDAPAGASEPHEARVGASAAPPRGGGRAREATPATSPLPSLAGRDDSLFTGSLAALARSRRFAGPPPGERSDRIPAVGSAGSSGASPASASAGSSGAAGEAPDATVRSVLPAVPPAAPTDPTDPVEPVDPVEPGAQRP